MRYFNILILILILFNIYYIYKFQKYKTENFVNPVVPIKGLTEKQFNVITNLSPHLIAIKNLSDLANQLMKGSLTIPGGLKINGDLIVDGKSVLGSDLNVGGKSVLGSDLSVGGNTSLLKTLDVKGITTLHNDTTIVGHCNFSNNMQVNGNSTIKGDLNLGYLQTINKDKLYDLFNIQTGTVSLCSDESDNFNCGWKNSIQNIKFNVPFKNTPNIILSIGGTVGIGGNWDRRGFEIRPYILLRDVSNIGFSLDWSKKDGNSWMLDKSYRITWIAIPK